MALKYAPQLWEHLDREIIWIYLIYFIVFISTMIFCLILGLKISSRIFFPIYALDKHIRNLTRGDWKIPELKIRETDEFHHLITSYNYFYRSLQVKTREEIKSLQLLKNFSLPQEAYRQIDLLIERQKNLIHETATPFGEVSRSPYERFVS